MSSVELYTQYSRKISVHPKNCKSPFPSSWGWSWAPSATSSWMRGGGVWTSGRTRAAPIQATHLLHQALVPKHEGITTNWNLGGKALNKKKKIFKDQDLKIAGLYLEIFEEKKVLFIVQRNQRHSSPAFWLCSETHTSAFGWQLGKKNYEREGTTGSHSFSPWSSWLCLAVLWFGAQWFWAIEWTPLRSDFLIHSPRREGVWCLSTVCGCVREYTHTYTCTPPPPRPPPVVRDLGRAGLQEGLCCSSATSVVWGCLSSWD